MSETAQADDADPNDESFLALNVKSEILQLQFQFALEHFKFHAQQRTTMFHFFLISLGLLLNAIVLLLKENLFVPAGCVALVGAVISLGFNFLDSRNGHLVKYGQDVLRFLEDKKLFKGAKYEGVTLGFMLREAKEGHTSIEKAQKWRKHGFWIPLIQRLAVLAFIAIAASMFYAPEWFIDQMPVRLATQECGS